MAVEKQPLTDEEVIKRLIASKDIDETWFASHGFEAGEDWARERATAFQLKLLAASEAELGDRFEQRLNCETAEFHFLDMIGCKDYEDGDEYDPEVFWWPEVCHKSEYRSPTFVRHFAAGALYVWKQFKDKLD